MDRETAIKIAKLVRQSGSELKESIDALRGRCDDDEFRRYCLAIGGLLADQSELLNSFVYSEHPDLAPAPPTIPPTRSFLRVLGQSSPRRHAALVAMTARLSRTRRRRASPDKSRLPTSFTSRQESAPEKPLDRGGIVY